ncbi:MAG: hypothetical protein JRJ19_13415, partial [Deltaproteobacteria bacterium]|nr:hypothetical protein [Deltaproteobacteria bacterium]
NQAIWGMRRFSIQDPKRSGYILEWIFHQWLKHEGLIALKYDFIAVTINGEDHGIYAIEESFGKELIEDNNRVAGPILKFDESRLIDDRRVNRGDKVDQSDIFYSADIISFDTAGLLLDEGLKQNYLTARSLLTDLRSGTKKLSEVFDVPKAARLFAALHMLSGYHAIRWKNIRFYYNPTASRIEPIAYNLYGPSARFPLMDGIYYQNWVAQNVGRFHVFDWINLFFSDQQFVEHYFYELNRQSSPGYLEAFFKGIEEPLLDRASLIGKNNPQVQPNLQDFFKNRDQAFQILHQKIPIKAYLKKIDSEKQTLTISVANTAFLPITVKSINCRALNKNFTKIGQTQIVGRTTGKPLLYSDIEIGDFSKEDEICSGSRVRLGDNLILNGLKISYQILGTRELRQANILAYPIKLAGYFLPPAKEIYSRLESLVERGVIRIEPGPKKIFITPGEWKLTSDLIIPSGYRVLGEAGTHINLNKGAAIISYSPVTLLGSREKPFVIQTDDGSGQGLVVVSARQASTLKHVIIKDLESVDKPGWKLTGAVTFFESKVSFENVEFRDCRAEDSLNIVRSDYSIAQTTFTNSTRDALDIDFSDGQIINSNFEKCGNDCIDLSGGTTALESITIKGAGDKGISVGERSRVKIDTAVVSATDMAVISKDGSQITANDMEISNSRVGYGAYQKKPVYSGGTVLATGTKMSGIKVPYLVEEGSRIKDNGQSIKPGTGLPKKSQ